MLYVYRLYFFFTFHLQCLKYLELKVHSCLKGCTCIIMLIIWSINTWDQRALKWKIFITIISGTIYHPARSCFNDRPFKSPALWEVDTLQSVAIIAQTRPGVWCPLLRLCKNQLLYYTIWLYRHLIYKWTTY